MEEKGNIVGPAVVPDKLYSIKEAAALLDLDSRRVHRDIKDGKLEAEKLGWVWVIKGSAIMDYRQKAQA